MKKADVDMQAGRKVFWKITAAGASFQAGSSAVDSATIVASLVNHLTGSVYAVGAASAILRLGWLLPQLVVGFLAQRSTRRMPYYMVGAFGRATCLAIIAALLAVADGADGWVAAAFLALWTLYSFVSGIVAVPYNDIVGRSIRPESRSRMLAWRFFGGGLMALGVAAIVHHLLSTGPLLTAYSVIFLLAAVLMFISSASFVSAGEPATAATPQEHASDSGFRTFLTGGLDVLKADHRFRLFLYTQWLAGVTLMALPFYAVAAMASGLRVADIGILLGAQTAGSLVSNALWGQIGDRHGKLSLLQSVSVLRILAPLGMLAILLADDFSRSEILWSFSILFFAIGALVNGTTIGYLGYLMEISPDAKRPSYSAYFNTLASPAALLPLVGAAIADTASLEAVFVVATGASALQILLLVRLGRWEDS